MRLYRDLPCLHRQDDRADGFHWLEAFPASGLGTLPIFWSPSLIRFDQGISGHSWHGVFAPCCISCSQASIMMLKLPAASSLPLKHNPIAIKDKDSGSQCVYCWKRMARHEREVGPGSRSRHVASSHRSRCREWMGTDLCDPCHDKDIGTEALASSCTPMILTHVGDRNPCAHTSYIIIPWCMRYRKQASDV